MRELLRSGMNDTALTSSKFSAFPAILFSYGNLLVNASAPLIYSRTYLIHELHKVFMLSPLLPGAYFRECQVVEGEFHQCLIFIEGRFQRVDIDPLFSFEIYVVCLPSGVEDDVLISPVVSHHEVGYHLEIVIYKLTSCTVPVVSFLETSHRSVGEFEKILHVNKNPSLTYGAHS